MFFFYINDKCIYYHVRHIYHHLKQVFFYNGRAIKAFNGPPGLNLMAVGKKSSKKVPEWPAVPPPPVLIAWSLKKNAAYLDLGFGL